MKVEIFRHSGKPKTEKFKKIKYGRNGEKEKSIQNIMILDDMFEAFADAIRANGDEPVFNYLPKSQLPEPAYQHALIFGYGRSFKQNGKSAIQDFRYKVLQDLKARGGHTVCFDAGYFKTMGNYEYHRVALDSPLNNGTFLHKKNNTDARWKSFQQQYEVPWREWTTTDDLILIFIQPDMGYSMNYAPTLDFIMSSVRRIRKYDTVSKIGVRGHPKSMKLGDKTQAMLKFCAENNIEFYDYTQYPLYPLLDRTKRAITYNSSVGVETAAYGVPTVTLHDMSMAWDVADHDIKGKSSLPDRTQWINDLAHTQWNAAEIATGELWAKFKEEMAKRDALTSSTF